MLWDLMDINNMTFVFHDVSGFVGYFMSGKFHGVFCYIVLEKDCKCQNGFGVVRQLLC